MEEKWFHMKSSYIFETFADNLLWELQDWSHYSGMRIRTNYKRTNSFDIDLLFMRCVNIYIATQHSHGIRFSLLPTPKLLSSDKFWKGQSKNSLLNDKWKRNLALRKSEYWSYSKINQWFFLEIVHLLMQM